MALQKVGGTIRKQAVEKMLNDMGGKMDAFYFAFGDSDVYVIGELPDTTTTAALALNINASGLVSISTTILLDPEEVDRTTKLAVSYRSPGS